MYTNMKNKNNRLSVYLSDANAEKLRRFAEWQGIGQSPCVNMLIAKNLTDEQSGQ